VSEFTVTDEHDFSNRLLGLLVAVWGDGSGWVEEAESARRIRALEPEDALMLHIAIETMRTLELYESMAAVATPEPFQRLPAEWPAKPWESCESG
jgi:hypothetical protein